jgi:hypothetical protein
VIKRPIAMSSKLPKSLEGFKTDDFLKIVFDSPDWPTALMVGAFIELMLEFSIALHFHPEKELSKTDRDELFNGYGPLSNFSAKISIGYALGILSKQTRDDLRIIKQIRNSAAHRIKDFSFSNEDIKQRCSSLVLIKIDRIDSTDYSEKWERLGTKSPRAKFTISTYNILIDILGRSASRFAGLALAALFAQLREKKITNEQFAKTMESVGLSDELKKIYGPSQ